MERSIHGARESMHEAVLNPEFQAALDDYEPAVEPMEQRVEMQDAPEPVEAVEPVEDGELVDLDFSELVDEVEAEAAAQSVSLTLHQGADDMAAAPQPILSPFTLLVNPAPAYAAAKRLESLGLPRRTVFLFGKKGPAADGSRFDADMDDSDEEQELEEATLELPLQQ